MKFALRSFLMLLLFFFVSGKSSGNDTIISFRLSYGDTKQVMSGGTVSIYDGFDARLQSYSGPAGSDNSGYYRGDKKTTIDGFLQIDLSSLKHNVLLLRAGRYYKYISHKGKQVVVWHYKKRNLSLEVTAIYTYNLKTRTVRISSPPADGNERTKKFSFIDIPMDS